jgi:hypothetical protein
MRGPTAGTGGVLNAAAFSEAAPSVLGNSGRNAFAGPGFYSVDLSAGRSFGLRWLGKGRVLTFRADAYHATNHANLGMPPANTVYKPAPAHIWGRDVWPARNAVWLPRREPAQ